MSAADFAFDAVSPAFTASAAAWRAQAARYEAGLGKAGGFEKLAEALRRERHPCASATREARRPGGVSRPKRWAVSRPSSASSRGSSCTMSRSEAPHSLRRAARQAARSARQRAESLGFLSHLGSSFLSSRRIETSSISPDAARRALRELLPHRSGTRYRLRRSAPWRASGPSSPSHLEAEAPQSGHTQIARVFGERFADVRSTPARKSFPPPKGSISLPSASLAIVLIVRCGAAGRPPASRPRGLSP